MLTSGNITIDMIKNLSIDDINRLTKAEMEEYIKAGARRMKDRAQRTQEAIERRGIKAPTRYEGLQEYADKMREYIDRPKANLNVMRKYIRDIQTNLRSGTSTFAGYQKGANEFVDKVLGTGEKMAQKTETPKRNSRLRGMSYKRTYDTLFRAYSRITEMYPVIKNSKERSSEAIQMEILNSMEDIIKHNGIPDVDMLVKRYKEKYGGGDDDVQVNPFGEPIRTEEDDEE